VKRSIAVFGSWLVVHVLHATLRVRHVYPERLERLPQYIIAFWHEHLLLMLHCRFRRPITVLTSRSRDGELMARAFPLFGVDVARGSSTRGGSAALRAMIRAARQGSNIVFTPDGPKGPRRVAKEGVVHAAQATGLPIVPIAFAAKKKSCCGHGIAWSFRCHSRARSSSMANRFTSPATQMWRKRECGSNTP
jgi:lysophospholipid acyltransferase (LPLAT)-like uncharacterized protein